MKVRAILWGIIIITVGIWLWLSNLGIITWKIVFRRDWPVIIIIFGLMGVVEAISRSTKSRRAIEKIVWGIVMVAVGLWIWLWKPGVSYLSFRKNWPLLIVIAGIYITICKLGRGKCRKNRRSGTLGAFKVNVEFGADKTENEGGNERG